ncbi:hypothetical protein SCLCIDRAFT_1223815 [Scleroderma citrinum Foug A]|uniref:Uncharacterized protein n=1 Tax=Scleroderma citrinum Foug A TaxID=1036808 RepID=A0A0C3D7L7_9AGAM|nr:hypothetical protein SCLCIDRAFT_1223815 [Scleroderma citrinum Foug A]
MLFNPYVNITAISVAQGSDADRAHATYPAHISVSNNVRNGSEHHALPTKRSPTYIAEMCIPLFNVGL